MNNWTLNVKWTRGETRRGEASVCHKNDCTELDILHRVGQRCRTGCWQTEQIFALASPSLPLVYTPLPDKWMFAVAFGTSCVHFVLTVPRHAIACTHTNTLAYAWACIDVKEAIAGSTKFSLVRHLESPVAYWTQLFNSAQHATPQIQRHATSTFHGNQFEC